MEFFTLWWDLYFRWTTLLNYLLYVFILFKFIKFDYELLFPTTKHFVCFSPQKEGLLMKSITKNIHSRLEIVPCRAVPFFRLIWPRNILALNDTKQKLYSLPPSKKIEKRFGQWTILWVNLTTDKKDQAQKNIICSSYLLVKQT